MSHDPSTLFFEGFTGSRYGHVGIVANAAMRLKHAGLPVWRVLTDVEVFEAWFGSGALERFSQIFKVDLSAPSDAMSLPATKVPYRDFPTDWRR